MSEVKFHGVEMGLDPNGRSALLCIQAPSEVYIMGMHNRSPKYAYQRINTTELT